MISLDRLLFLRIYLRVKVMQIGIIGCGNMGGGMANTLTKKGKKTIML